MVNTPTPPNGFRTFVIVWATQSLSVVGSALTFFAVNIWLTQTLYPLPEQKPELGLSLAAITLAFMLPTIFGAPIAGAWADRHDRRRIMIVCDLFNGVLNFALAALVLAGMLQLWLLIVLLVLQAIASAFHQAAFDTSYVMLVPPAQLPRANGMMQTVWAFSGIISPVLAAIIISLPSLARQGSLSGPLSSVLALIPDGSALAIGLDAITFVFAAVVLMFLSIPSPVRTDLSSAAKPSLMADVRAGASYIWLRRPLLWLLGTFTVANFTSAGAAVYDPLLIRFRLVEDWSTRGFTFETALALLSSALGIGGLIGGIAISVWGGLRHRRVYGVLVPMIISGVAQVLMGLSELLFLTAAMGMIVAGMVPMMNAHSQAIWQTQTPPELQGRVFSVRRVIAQCTAPLATFLAGIFGGLFDPGMVVAVMGAILTVFCVAQLFNPWMLRVEDKQWLDEMAERDALSNAQQPS